MPSVTTQYRMFVPRRRRIGGGGSAIDLVPPAVNFVSGDAAAGAPDTIEVHYPNAGSPAAPANFAFWSVLGSSDGEYTDRPGTPGNFISAHTGSGPLTMTAWYLFAGGGGNGPPGTPELETDAFLVDQNQFVDPTPIESVSPADAWDPSDVREFVFTTESSSVFALDSVVDPNEHFETWYAFEGNSLAAGKTLQVPEGDDGIAIATYRIPPPVHLPRLGEGEEIGGTLVGGVARDGGGGIIINGIFHPIGPWDPFLSALAVLRAARGLQSEARLRVQREALRAIGAEAQHLQGQLKSEGEREL